MFCSFDEIQVRKGSLVFWLLQMFLLLLLYPLVCGHKTISCSLIIFLIKLFTYPDPLSCSNQVYIKKIKTCSVFIKEFFSAYYSLDNRDLI